MSVPFGKRVVDCDGEGALPFLLTSPAVPGTPAFIRDTDASNGFGSRPSPRRHRSTTTRFGISATLRAWSSPRVGHITPISVRKRRLFRTETAIPAGVIASVADDRVTLNVSADVVKKLEPSAVGEPGAAAAR